MGDQCDGLAGRDSGHFLTEENPDMTAKLLREFFLADVARVTRSEASRTSAHVNPEARKTVIGALRAMMAPCRATERTIAAPGKIPAAVSPLRFRRPPNIPRAHGGRSAAQRTAPRIDRAALGVGRAVIQPSYPRERDRAGAHRAGLQRDIEVAIDQPLAAEACGGLPDREDFGMRGRIAIAQSAVSGRRDHLVIKHDHASNRHFAGFPCIFGCFQRQIHERRGGHASYCPDNSARRCGFSKSGYRFCVRMRLDQRARAYRRDN